MWVGDLEESLIAQAVSQSVPAAAPVPATTNHNDFVNSYTSYGATQASINHHHQHHRHDDDDDDDDDDIDQILRQQEMERLNLTEAVIEDGLPVTEIANHTYQQSQPELEREQQQQQQQQEPPPVTTEIVNHADQQQSQLEREQQEREQKELELELERERYKAERNAAKKERRRLEREAKAAEEAAASAAAVGENKEPSKSDDSPSCQDEVEKTESSEVGEEDGDDEDDDDGKTNSSKKRESKQEKKRRKFEERMLAMQKEFDERALFWESESSKEKDVVQKLFQLALAEFCRKNPFYLREKLATETSVQDALLPLCREAFRKFFDGELLHSNVIVKGLGKKQEDLNDRPGIIEYWDDSKSKFMVSVEAKKGNRFSLLLPPGNLEAAPVNKNQEEETWRSQRLQNVY